MQYKKDNKTFDIHIYEKKQLRFDYTSLFTITVTQIKVTHEQMLLLVWFDSKDKWMFMIYKCLLLNINYLEAYGLYVYV